MTLTFQVIVAPITLVCQHLVGGLSGEELGPQHLAGSIVNEGNQATLVGATLEPVVWTAVDLQQLTSAGTSLSLAVLTPSAAFLGLAQPSLDHPSAQHLPGPGKFLVIEHV